MDGRRSRRIPDGRRAGDVDVGCAGSSRGPADARIGVRLWWRWNRTLRDRLLGYGMLCRSSNRVGYLILLQDEGMLKDHLYWRAYIEEEIVGTCGYQ